MRDCIPPATVDPSRHVKVIPKFQAWEDLMPRVCATAVITGTLLLCNWVSAHAQTKYGPGVTDTEIKIGQTMPYSGPLTGLSSVGKVEAAYFEMINAKGGINGRKIKLISLDDGYNPAKTLELTRKLVEGDEVLAIVSSLGTAPNTAIHRYLNTKGVPQLFISTGGTRWGDPANFPWTMGFQPNFQFEGRVYARYIQQQRPAGRIAVMYENDDFGKDLVKGLRDGLGSKAGSMIVKEVSYEVTDPTIDSQIITLAGSGADVFFDASLPKFAAQAIRKMYDIGWKPLHVLDNGSASVSVVLKPAGLEKSIGIVSAQFLKDPANQAWTSDPGYLEWLAFMKQYFPSGDIGDQVNATGYSIAQTFVQVLKQCGDDLTRENLMKQAANLKDLTLPMLLPGIKVNTSPTHFFPVDQLNIIRFDGTAWALEGALIDN
jgi:branched-chain amino acid transport system substrate-binding protein